MTKRVAKRRRSETTEQKYNRLTRRIIRRLPVTAAETTFVWREKSLRILRDADVKSLMRSLAFSREEAESVVDQVDADSERSP